MVAATNKLKWTKSQLGYTAKLGYAPGDFLITRCTFRNRWVLTTGAPGEDKFPRLSRTLTAAKQRAENIVAEQVSAAAHDRAMATRAKLVRCILRDGKTYSPFVAQFGTWWEWAEAKVGCTGVEVREANRLSTPAFDALDAIWETCRHEEEFEGLLTRYYGELIGEDVKLVRVADLPEETAENEAA